MIRKYRYGTPFNTEALTEKIETTEGILPYGEVSQEEGFVFTYIMDEDDIVYGLGEANRGINKRGYCYISNCTDDPVHTEDKRSLYGAHNFIIVSGSRRRHRRHGLHLRRCRGSHRLPDGPGREGRPGEGAPVPSVRHREVLRGACPTTCKKLAVLDRTKEPGARASPLYLDVVNALMVEGRNGIKVVTGGRYGLGSKDTPPASVFAVYDRAGQGRAAQRVHHRHRRRRDRPVPARGHDCAQHRGPGHHRVQVLGSGRRRHRRREQELRQDHRRPHRQVRAGLLPVRLEEDRRRDHQPPALRRSRPSAASYYINKADFVACHNPSYITKDFPIVKDVKPGGAFMINCQWTPEELEHHLSAEAKRYIAANNVQLYTINAIDLARRARHGQAHQHHPAVRVLHAGQHPAGRGRRAAT